MIELECPKCQAPIEFDMRSWSEYQGVSPHGGIVHYYEANAIIRHCECDLTECLERLEEEAADRAADSE